MQWPVFCDLSVSVKSLSPSWITFPCLVWSEFSPVDNPKTTPFAMTTGSGRLKSPEIHAGSRTGFFEAGAQATLKGMMPPGGFGPVAKGKLGAVFAAGPHTRA